MHSCSAIYLNPQQLFHSHRNAGFLNSNLDIRDPPVTMLYRIKHCHESTYRSYKSRLVMDRSLGPFRFPMNRHNHHCGVAVNSGISGKGPDPEDSNVLSDTQSARPVVDEWRTYVTLESEEISEEGEEVGSGDGGVQGQSSSEFLKLKRELEESRFKGLDDGEEDGKEKFAIPRVPRSAVVDSDEEEEGGKLFRMRGWASGRQVLKRSSFLAKQVISIRSACSLGFISQLWVDTKSWLVVFVEVKPSILSGESEKILLEDVTQVGDVVLIEDESVTENELKMIGLDTMIGYNVMTSSRRYIGKVRDFLFNINSGAVESLELDSFGTSLIPSSLISTYCLLVEDILDVVSDKIIVHDGTVSRIQRLTKGFWDTLSTPAAEDDMAELSGYKRRRNMQDRRTRRKFTHRKAPRIRDIENEWDLPMEY